MIGKAVLMNIETFPQPSIKAVEVFPTVFDGESGNLGIAWAPGRVNLIGEHTDYNDGFVLPLAIDRVSAFAGRVRGDRTIRLWSTHFDQYAQFSLDGLPETFEQQRTQLPNWARYILGVVTELLRAGFALHGFDAVVSGDVPLGGGMSSSAALEVATAQACALFSGGKFTIGEHNAVDEQGALLAPLQVAALCQRAEHIASGLKSGILDQAASCLGQPEKAVLLDCRSLAYRYLPFNAPGVSVMVIDTGVRRELAASAYNERRQQCEEAVQILRGLIEEHEPDNQQAHEIKALRDITQEQFDRYKQALPAILRQRAGYILAENERVLQTVAFLEKDDIEAVGAILWRGHAGLRDEYQVSCEELDALVEIAHQVPGVLGARMMGGGFGGCTVNLVRTDAIEALREAVWQQYPQRTGRQASVDICNAAGGPGSAML